MAGRKTLLNDKNSRAELVVDENVFRRTTNKNLEFARMHTVTLFESVPMFLIKMYLVSYLAIFFDKNFDSFFLNIVNNDFVYAEHMNIELKFILFFNFFI